MPAWNLALAAFAAFVVAAAVCGLVRSLAVRHSLVDEPNQRSLHTVPVPRLGGVGIAAGSLLAAAVSAALLPRSSTLVTWILAAIPVAGLGLVDDLRPLSARVRLAIQVALAAICAGFMLGPGESLFATGVSVDAPRGVLIAFGVIWIVGVLNIYNFMDGMDGLAGLQGVLASTGLAVVFAERGQGDLAVAAVALAGGSGGFLLHNMPPAKIFMGDSASTLLGFGLASLALAGATRADPVPFVVTPLALAPFLLDWAFTLLRRARRGEKVWQAHKSHVYQRAVGTSLSHHDVLVPYACWMALAAGCAIVAAHAGGIPTIVVGGLMVAVLASMVVWVQRRERAGAASSP